MKLTFKIAGLQQNVLRFDIKMRHVASMQVVQSLQHFPYAQLCFVLWQFIIVEKRLEFTTGRPVKHKLQNLL